VHRAVLAIAAQGTAPETMLDIGRGTGRLLRAAHAQWPAAHLIGVDPATGMVEQARRLTPDATFLVAPAEAPPLPDKSVDLAVSTISFHHWADQEAGLREIARVLRPGGRFLLADWAPPDWLGGRLRRAGFRSPKQVRALFAAAGLAVDTQRQVRIARVLGMPARICVTVGLGPTTL
jgi:ubiquinone/menaquinone biosynthesis C-methylase UbiE